MHEFYLGCVQSMGTCTVVLVWEGPLLQYSSHVPVTETLTLTQTPN